MSTQKDVPGTPLLWYVEYYGGNFGCMHMRCGHNNPEKAVQDFAFICFGGYTPAEELKCLRFFQSDGSVNWAGLPNRLNETAWIYPEGAWEVEDFGPKTIRYVQYAGVKFGGDCIDFLALPCELEDHKAIIEVYQFIGGSDMVPDESDDNDGRDKNSIYCSHCEYYPPNRYAFFDRTIACVNGVIVEIDRSTITQWYFRSDTIVLSPDQAEAYLRAPDTIPPEHHVFNQFIVEMQIRDMEESIPEWIASHRNKGENIAVYAFSSHVDDHTAAMFSFFPEDIVLPKLG